jgi:hypothetical protein
VFLINSRYPLVCATLHLWLPETGHPSPEVTDAICLVPSTSFSQAPWYTLPVHLCRFGVRSIWWAISWKFTAHRQNPITCTTFASVTSHRFRNINLIPIDYAFRPRLRGRLTLRRLTLRRKPWTFGENVSHILYATYVSILTSDTSSKPYGSPSQAYRTLRYHSY